MPVARYRVTNPTIARFDEDGRHVARMVPVGAIITIVAFDGNKLVNVTWDSKKVMMFTQDLRISGSTSGLSITANRFNALFKHYP